MAERLGQHRTRLGEMIMTQVTAQSSRTIQRSFHDSFSRHVVACFALCSIVSAVCCLVGCDKSRNGPTPVASDGDPRDVPSVSIQLNWYPEAEHGGVYQAVADGTYEEVGVNVQIRPGGRATPVAPELKLGRVQFAFANADDVVVFRREGLDIVTVFAAMQNSPRCILVREDSGVDSLDRLAGMTLQCKKGRPFVEYMRSRGLLDQVKEVPYFGSVSTLVSDKSIAIQAYSFAEPLLAEQQGVSVKRLMLREIGWNPYASVLVTTGKLIKEQPELVRQVVEATRRGWEKYINDPKLANEAILADNEHGMTAEALEFGCRELKSLVLPESMAAKEIGQMSEQRWRELVEQMDAIDPKFAGKVKPEDCFTTEFLP